ncbi:MAG: FAD-dependent oxidoreductase [Pseudooceanicola sp.]
MAADASQFDVLVAGGGAGGVGAAIGAARAGARVALVEKYGFLGGAATNAQVLAYCGFFHHGGEAAVQSVAGAGEAVRDALRDLGLDCRPYHSPTTGNWIILLDPERLKIALDRVLAANGVEVLLHSRVSAAARTGERLDSVTVAGMDGRFEMPARAFVDASGDANLALVAGQDMRIGDGEGRIQAFTMPIRVGGLNLEGRVDREAIKRAVDLFNTRSPHPIHRSDGGIFTRVEGANDFWWLIIDRDMPDLSSRSFTRAEQEGREMALTMVEALRETVPGFEKSWLAQTGPQIGVRETRHPAARYEISHDDVLSGRLRDDGVARASWPIELHSEAGKPSYEFIGGEGYYHVPLDALHARGIDNLFYGGRVIGADPRAYGSTRVMGTAFASGEAAGVAAALTAGNGHPPEAEAVRRQLRAQGALI